MENNNYELKEDVMTGSNSNNTPLRYFFYHFKESFLRLLIMCIISANVMFYSVDKIGRKLEFSSSSYVVLLGIAAFFLPQLELKQFKNRRNLDLWYQMPIKRRTLGLIHYLNALVQVVLAYLVGSVLVCLRVVDAGYNPIGIIGLIFVTTLAFALILGYNMFIYDRANTHRDGWMFQIAYNCLVPSVLIAFAATFIRLAGWEELDYSGILSAIFFGPNIIMYKAAGLFEQIVADEFGFNTYSSFLVDVLDENYVFTAIFCILTIILTVGFIMWFGKTPSYKIEDVSDSWFGFKMLIPTFSVSSTLIMGSAAGVTFFMNAALCYIAYAIYRRSPKIRRKDILMIIALSVFCIVWSIICEALWD